jgi:hypothetical protein
MRLDQIEAWVLQLVDLVTSGKRIEDSRVELKRDWPEPKRAARRVAGHGNASGGDLVLWIIGLDEKEGIVATKPTELARWRSELVAEFDGLAPAFQDLVIPTRGGALTALVFDTTRRPYVVKNPAFGTGGSVELEVPWREGTSIRSARREDLMRLLVPLESLPSIELLSAGASVSVQKALDPRSNPQANPICYSQHIRWNVEFELYVTPRTSDLVVFPKHRMKVTIDHGPESFIADEIFVNTPFRYAPTSYGIPSFQSDSETISITNAEALIRGPGRLSLTANYHEPERRLGGGEILSVTTSLRCAGDDRLIQISAKLRVHSADIEQTLWELDEKG